MHTIYRSGIIASLVTILFWFALICTPSIFFSFLNTDKLVTLIIYLIAITLNAYTFKPQKFSLNKAKLIGAFFTVVAVLVGLNMIYFFNSHGYYFITNLIFYIPLFSITLLIFEGFSSNTYLEQLGINLLANKNNEINWRYFFISVFLKVFFACFLFDMLVIVIKALINADILNFPTTDWFNLLHQLGLMIDIGIGIVGYIFAAKYFKNSIKSFNPYMTGIIVCFLCYPPFNQLISDFVRAPDTFIWSHWLEKGSALYLMWGSLMVVTWAIYWWATIAFGNSFSNLTFRRLIYWGPYRYCAHPAYLAKNIYWWLLSVPFVITTTLIDSFIAILVVLFWNGLYYLRAKTEELHLSQYPAYRRYLKRVPLKCF